MVLAIGQLVKYLRATDGCDLVWMSLDCYTIRVLQHFGMVNNLLGLVTMVVERTLATLNYDTYENRWRKLSPTLLAFQVW